MKEKRNLHLKVQEMCDCFATRDPLKEMSQINEESDTDQAAVKWVALAALHGINANAKKISITQKNNDTVSVTAEHQKAELPAPSLEITEKIFHSIREITHIEGEKGKTLLSLGIRDSSIEIKVKFEKDTSGNRITFKFME